MHMIYTTTLCFVRMRTNSTSASGLDHPTHCGSGDKYQHRGNRGFMRPYPDTVCICSVEGSLFAEKGAQTAV